MAEATVELGSRHLFHEPGLRAERNVFFTEPALTFPWTRIPQPRAVAAGGGRVVAVPLFGGLHHRYEGCAG